jgi:hypothetical protein
MVYYIIISVLSLYTLAMIGDMIAWLLLRRRNSFSEIRDLLKGLSVIIWAVCFFYLLVVMPQQKNWYLSLGLFCLLIGTWDVIRFARAHYFSLRP